MLKNAAQRPKNNRNPSWGSENNLYCAESLRFCRTMELSLYSKNRFRAMLIGFGDT